MRSVTSNTAPALSPKSTLFVEHSTGVPVKAPPHCRVLLVCGLVLPELCVDSFDTAPPPHDLLAGVFDTALLPLTGDSSPDLNPVAPEWTILSHADLSEICHRASTTTDLSEICHRASTTTDLSELCLKSYDLPDPLIPALPSYELDGSSSFLCIQPHDMGEAPIKDEATPSTEKTRGSTKE
ncbi:uncharacterized protein UHOR_06469 [Ustilago hordei]|uniref:Uncharacterized protein n=1 Tax=Ustilago hordei TaxID=120017 RepID=I2FNV2_USTHO|nr:uncharacterized protein UHOR_06469 [Ustilago hordei]